MQRVTGRSTRISPLGEIASPRGGRARLCPYARLALCLCYLCAWLNRRKTHTSHLVLYFLYRLCLFVAIQKEPG